MNAIMKIRKYGTLWMQLWQVTALDQLFLKLLWMQLWQVTAFDQPFLKLLWMQLWQVTALDQPFLKLLWRFAGPVKRKWPKSAWMCWHFLAKGPTITLRLIQTKYLFRALVKIWTNVKLINCKATSYLNQGKDIYVCGSVCLDFHFVRNLLREEFVGKKLHKTAYSPANTYR